MIEFPCSLITTSRPECDLSKSFYTPEGSLCKNHYKEYLKERVKMLKQQYEEIYGKPMH